MGNDLYGVTGHKLTPDQVIDFQQVLETDDELRKLYPYHEQNDYDKWQNITDPSDLLYFWQYNQNQFLLGDKAEFYELRLSCYFGELVFHPHVVSLDGFNHKLMQLLHPSDGPRILAFYKRLGYLLGQPYIVYCGNYSETYDWITDFRHVKTIDEIIANLHRLGQGRIADLEQSLTSEGLYIQDLKYDSS